MLSTTVTVRTNDFFFWARGLRSSACCTWQHHALGHYIAAPGHPVSGKPLVDARLLGEILSARCDLFDSRILVASKQDSHLYRGGSESSNAGNCVGSMNQG